MGPIPLFWGSSLAAHIPNNAGSVLQRPTPAAHLHTWARRQILCCCTHSCPGTSLAVAPLKAGMIFGACFVVSFVICSRFFGLAVLTMLCVDARSHVPYRLSSLSHSHVVPTSLPCCSSLFLWSRSAESPWLSFPQCSTAANLPSDSHSPCFSSPSTRDDGWDVSISWMRSCLLCDQCKLHVISVWTQL